MERKMQEFGEMAVLCPLVGGVGRSGGSWLDPLQTPRGALHLRTGRDRAWGLQGSDCATPDVPGLCHSRCSWSV